jgi:hypothetical protein
MANNITAQLKLSSHLVKRWGDAVLPDGRSLQGALTLEGISLWSVVSSDLATTGVAKRLSDKSSATTFKDQFIHTLKNTAKRLMFDAKRKLYPGRRKLDFFPDGDIFLFLGFSHYIYRETLEPVAKKLQDISNSNVVVIDDQYKDYTRSVVSGELRQSTVWQFSPPEVEASIDMMRRSLNREKSYLVHSDILKRIIEDTGCSWAEFKPLFDWLLDTYFHRLIVYIAIAKYIIARHRPSLIISPDVNDPRTRIFCLAARLENIKTLEVQFHFTNPTNVEWDFFIADHLAVTGPNNFEQMLGHGIHPSKLSITGSARYEHPLFNGTSASASEVRASYKVDENTKIVLFASQPYYHEAFSSERIRKEMILDLFRTASNSSGKTLVVKPHPFDRVDELRSLASSFNNIVIVDKRVDIRFLINASDMFVTFFSATTFDALFMKKPTLHLAYPGAYHDNTFEDCGATSRAVCNADISHFFGLGDTSDYGEAVIKRELARVAFLKGWFNDLDGQATDRIVSIAMSLKRPFVPAQEVRRMLL